MRRTRDRNGVVRGCGGAWTAAALACLLAATACGTGDGPGGAGGTDGKGLDLSPVISGWGPDREVYTEKDRPRRVVLNSVTDNPRYGDERNFLAVKDLATGRWQAENDVEMKAGRTYEVSVFFRNDGAPGTAGASTGTRVRAELPASVEGREPASVFLQSDNAAVPLMWQSAVFASPAGAPVDVRIISGTSRAFTRSAPHGIPLDQDELFSDVGALVGCSAADGVVTGEDGCQGYVRFRFVVDQPNFEVSQSVAPSGPRRPGKGMRFEAGTRVTYTITYRNTGTTRQSHVVLKEELPDGFRHVRGSTEIATDGTWRKAVDGITRTGLDVGSYDAGGAVRIRFTALIPDGEHLACGLTGATATASARTQNGMKSAPLAVLVEKKCP